MYKDDYQDKDNQVKYLKYKERDHKLKGTVKHNIFDRLDK